MKNQLQPGTFAYNLDFASKWDKLTKQEKESQMLKATIEKLENGWSGLYGIENHSDANGFQFIANFYDGYQASIILNEFSQGLEMAILKDNEVVYDTPLTDDVIGYIGSVAELDGYLSQLNQFAKEQKEMKNQELFNKFLNAETLEAIAKLPEVNSTTVLLDELAEKLEALSDLLNGLEPQDPTPTSEWVVEYNENDSLVPDFSGCKVTAELLSKIKALDIETTNLHDGYYKFYFEKIENGQVTKKIRFEIGGWEKNEIDLEFYEFMASEISEAVETPTTGTTAEQVQSNVKELLKTYVKQEANHDEPTSKLDRLKAEKADALAEWAEYSQKVANGQPVNDKKDNQAYYKGLERIENRIRSLDEQIAEQEAVERRKQEKIDGLNSNGGLLLTIDNIDRIRLEIEKAEQGQSIYSPATIRKYKKALETLEQQAEQVEQLHNNKLAELLANGTLRQWKKRPKYFFIKGLKKVAILLDGQRFKIAKRYAPTNKKDIQIVNDLLEQLNAA